MQREQLLMKVYLPNKGSVSERIIQGVALFLNEDL